MTRRKAQGMQGVGDKSGVRTDLEVDQVQARRHTSNTRGQFGDVLNSCRSSKNTLLMICSEFQPGHGLDSLLIMPNK